MTGLESYLETIEPELRVLTRLFGYDESVWAEPVRFSPFVEEITENGVPQNRIVIFFQSDPVRWR